MHRVKNHFISIGCSFLIDRIREFDESSATVELAALRVGCEPKQIAKSISCIVKIPVSKEENKQLQKKKSQEQRKSKNNGDIENAASPNSSSEPNSPNTRNELPTVIVAAGDAKISNKLFKQQYNCPFKMPKNEEVEAVSGFAPGGVCPFGVNDNVQVFLDVSLKRFTVVYPACGEANSAIEMTIDELEKYTKNFTGWVDVCDGWDRNEVCDIHNKTKHDADANDDDNVPNVNKLSENKESQKDSDGKSTDASVVNENKIV